MKLVIMMMVLLAIAARSLGQETPATTPLTKQDYLQKSNNQKTAAWILLGGGVALGIGGAVWAGSDWNATAPDALLIVGGASLLGSIPLFIAAGKNKRKAMSMSLKMQQAPQLKNHSLVSRAFPSINLRISL